MTTSPLIPDRYPNHDLFICDVAEAVFKDIMPHMEHPFYSLSKKPELKIRRYEHNGNWLEITPSVKGLATIYDKDILIYCISQLMAALKREEPVSKRVRINSRELLMFTNRGTGGKDYTALREAIERLAGTRIATNIKTGDEEQYDTFGLIDASSIRREHGLDGRLLWCDVTLSDWVFNAIQAKEVLTLHRDYFRLRKPLERRIYEVARKHCGSQDKWEIRLAKLHKKTGSTAPLKRFRLNIKQLADSDHLPDYWIEFYDDKVIFRPKKRLSLEHDYFPDFGLSTQQKIVKILPGADPINIIDEWEHMLIKKGYPPLKSAEASLIGYAKSLALKKPHLTRIY